MRASLRSFVAVVVAGGIFAACSSKQCTLVGCQDQFHATITSADGSIPPGLHVVEVTADGATISCSFRVTSGGVLNPACPTGLHVAIGQETHCAETGVGYARTQTCDPIPGRFFEDVTVVGKPAAVSVRVLVDGVALVDRDLAPAYQSTQPNGPGCDPTCRQASARWMFSAPGSGADAASDAPTDAGADASADASADVDGGYADSGDATIDRVSDQGDGPASDAADASVDRADANGDDASDANAVETVGDGQSLVGHWTFVSGTNEIKCTDGSSNTKNLAGDYIDVSRPATTLIAYYYCDWKLDVNGAGEAVVRPDQTCGTLGNEGTHFMWTATIFTISSTDGHAGTLSAKLSSDYTTPDAGTGSCALTITGVLQK